MNKYKVRTEGGHNGKAGIVAPFEYQIKLEDREYKVGGVIEHEGNKYKVRELGKTLIVYMMPIK
ncbi:hypothetical protein [Bacillus sp. FSL K6-6540]|uniref:hypothetical protein n=1 Tax=Bacillus sp. FSL K6-6540 TaxID=2921512 RepID=UPI0030F80A58